MGEGVRVEFKETFLYDVHQDQANKGPRSYKGDCWSRRAGAVKA